jgi:hypothetical protein
VGVNICVCVGFFLVCCVSFGGGVAAGAGSGWGNVRMCWVFWIVAGVVSEDLFSLCDAHTGTRGPDHLLGGGSCGVLRLEITSQSAAQVTCTRKGQAEDKQGMYVFGG